METCVKFLPFTEESYFLRERNTMSGIKKMRDTSFGHVKVLGFNLGCNNDLM